MARLYEYQGKDVLSKIGLPVPKGKSAASPSEAKKIAEEIGKPCVVKAQVWATGRFKAGGIKFAKSPAEAEEAGRAFGQKAGEGALVRGQQAEQQHR